LTERGPGAKTWAVSDFYTFEQLRNWQETAPSLAPPARFAVIGDPVGHSKSPQMHNPALKACGVDAQYIRVQVPAGRVREAFELFARHGFGGVNITIPHKQEAMAAVDEVDTLARQLGAVNTLVIRNGSFHGHNTDGPGFIRSVREAFGADVRDLSVLVLGAAGGAGRAVVMQCLLSGCWKLLIANRSQDRLLELEKEMNALRQGRVPRRRIIRKNWDPASLALAVREADLIVNATSLGMKDGDPALLPGMCLSPWHLVYDMVYRAGGDTPLIADAKAAGARHADGMSLLLHQGAIAFEHWFPGVTAPLEVMRAGLAAA